MCGLPLPKQGAKLQSLPLADAANAVLTLAHKSCPTTGAMYQTEGGTVRKIRVEVSRGLKYDPTKHGLDYVSENWADTYDFHDSLFPGDMVSGKHPEIDRTTGKAKL